MNRIAYRYRHAPVPGGGYVTGILFHPNVRGLVYARTDIGGVYRRDARTGPWTPLAARIPHPDRWETYPLSIAVSPFDTDALFVAAGDGEKNNRLCISRDRGESFTYREIPTGVHGNASGRGTGERLVASACDPDMLYFASQTGGLFKTRDLGHRWVHLPVQTDGRREETNLTFVCFHPHNEKVLLVGTNGAGNPQGNVRGPSVYLSTDGCAHFSVLPGQPAPLRHPASTYFGYVAQRCVFDGPFVYITYIQPGYCWAGLDSYATDTGSCVSGALMRFRMTPDGTVLECTDITPGGHAGPESPSRQPDGGLAGLCTLPDHPGTLMTATVCSPEADTVFLSADSGARFTPILRGLSVGEVDFTVPYMQPRYQGGRSILHWMSDIAVDPFDADFAMVNSGTGIFAAENLTDALQNRPVRWHPLCNGLEETVHLNAYSPSTGPIKLIDIVGDLGGFAFRTLDKPCENSFADAHGNRYITCINADYPEGTTAPIAVTARGNWTGATTGGLILSDDYAASWTRLPDPVGLSPQIDRLIAAIRRPNVNAGWTAVSADGETIVWGLADGNELPASALVRTTNRGAVWERCRMLMRDGSPVAGENVKVFSDRLLPDVFYGFGEGGQVYVSRDSARTFRACAVPPGFPARDLAGIDSRQDVEIRADFTSAGVVCLALAEHGLWRLSMLETHKIIRGKRVSAPGDTVYRVGLGRPADGQKTPTLFLSGILSGEYGFFRSVDGGEHFSRIHTDRQMYGDIRSIAGDPRVFGRCYIATGTMGILYGEPENE